MNLQQAKLESQRISEDCIRRHREALDNDPDSQPSEEATQLETLRAKFAALAEELAESGFIARQQCAAAIRAILSGE